MRLDGPVPVHTETICSVEKLGCICSEYIESTTVAQKLCVYWGGIRISEGAKFDENLSQVKNLKEVSKRDFTLHHGS